MSAVRTTRKYDWLSGWPAERKSDRELYTRFVGRMRESMRGASLQATLVLLLGNLIFWVFDPLALSEVSDVAPIMHLGRLFLTATGLITLALVAWLPRRAHIVVAIAGPVAMGFLSGTLAACGGLDTPWPYLTLPFFLLTVGLWWTPLGRSAVLASLAAAQIGAMGLVHPDFFSSPLVMMAGGFDLFVVAMCWVLGTLTSRTRMDHFITTEQLRHERTQLVERVEEQTRAVNELSRRVEAVRHAERASLARDVREDFGRVLSDARLVLRMASDRYASDPLQIGTDLDMIESSLTQLTEHTERLLRSARTKMVTRYKLDNALDALVQRMGEVSNKSVSYRGIGGEVDASHTVCATMWSCAEEALAPRASDPRAYAIRVALEQTPHHLILSIDDDAPRGDLGKQRERLGELERRVASLDGSLSMQALPNGTRLELRLPRGSVSSLPPLAQASK